MVLVRVLSSIAPDRQLADEHAREDGEEVADVQRHDRKHAGLRMLVTCPKTNNPWSGEKTYSKYPTPACTVKIHALGKSVLNLQGEI